MRRKLCVAVIAGLVVVSAATASARVTTGWRTHTATDRSFTLAVPATWLDTFQITPQLVAQRKLPDLVKNMVAKINTSPTFRFAAYDLTPGKVLKQFATNVNVSVYPEPAGTTVQEVAALTLGQLAASKLLVGKPQSSLVTLPAGQAYRLTFHLRGVVTTASTQYGFIHNGVAFAVSYTTTQSAGRAYEPTFTHSIHTFRFTY